MAKGGLTTDHTLICPIAHYPSTVEMPDVRTLLAVFFYHKLYALGDTLFEFLSCEFQHIFLSLYSHASSCI